MTDKTQKTMTALAWMELADKLIIWDDEKNADLVEKIRSRTEPIWDAQGDKAEVTLSLNDGELKQIDDLDYAD